MDLNQIGTHVINLYVNAENLTYFENWKYSERNLKKIIGNKNIIANIHRIQAYDSIMCGNFCIGYIDFMLNGNKLC